MLSKYLSVDSTPLPSYFSRVIMDILQWGCATSSFSFNLLESNKGTFYLSFEMLALFCEVLSISLALSLEATLILLHVVLIDLYVYLKGPFGKTKSPSLSLQPSLLLGAQGRAAYESNQQHSATVHWFPFCQSFLEMIKAAVIYSTGPAEVRLSITRLCCFLPRLSLCLMLNSNGNLNSSESYITEKEFQKNFFSSWKSVPQHVSCDCMHA